MTELRFPDGQVLVVEATGPDLVFTALLPPRLSGPPAHRHRNQTESFAVLEGRLAVRVGRERRTLLPGDSVTVPPGLTHAFANPFDEPARIRTVESPAGPLLPQLRAMAANGGRPPLLELARINGAHDVSLTVAGLPDAVQRPLWRLLARVAGRRHVP